MITIESLRRDWQTVGFDNNEVYSALRAETLTSDAAGAVQGVCRPAAEFHFLVAVVGGDG